MAGVEKARTWIRWCHVTALARNSKKSCRSKEFKNSIPELYNWATQPSSRQSLRVFVCSRFFPILVCHFDQSELSGWGLLNFLFVGTCLQHFRKKGCGRRAFEHFCLQCPSSFICAWFIDMSKNSWILLMIQIDSYSEWTGLPKWFLIHHLRSWMFQLGTGASTSGRCPSWLATRGAQFQAKAPWNLTIHGLKILR